MARGYPRFLISAPKHTKDKGPFIVHLLEPQFICRVVDRTKEDITLLKNYYINLSGWTLELLKVFTKSADEKKVHFAMYDMVKWAANQKDI